MKTTLLYIIAGIFLISCNSSTDNSGDHETTAAAAVEGVHSEVLKMFKISDIVIPEGNKPLECRGMRFRRLALNPGGEIGIHSHENRPAILSVVGGVGMDVFAYSEDAKEAATPTTVQYAQSYSHPGAIHYAVNLSKTDTLQLITFDLLDNGSECSGIKYPQHTRLFDKLKEKNDPFYANAPKSAEEELNIPIYNTPVSEIQFKEGKAALKDRIFRSRKITLEGNASIPPQNFENRPTYIMVLEGGIDVKRNDGGPETLTRFQTAKFINQQGNVSISNASATEKAVYLVMEIWDPADKDIL